MSFDLAALQLGLAETLAAGVDPVTVFDHPPDTFNVPAVIVGYPELVTDSGSAMGVDEIRVPVVAAVGIGEAGPLGDLLNAARAAVVLDRSLGGVAKTARPLQYRLFRAVTVGGATYLTAELLLEIHM